MQAEQAAPTDLLPPRPFIAWRRIAKAFLGMTLLLAGALTIYHQLVIRVSRDAVVNASTVAIRAPIDGVATAALVVPGKPLPSGALLGRLEDPLPDEARLFQLQDTEAATERQRDDLERRLADLRRARAQADAQAEAYRRGRVQQDELLVEEARATLAAAAARATEATANAGRGAVLHSHGFQSDQAQERLRSAQAIAQADALAARKHLDALLVDLESARSGTYLGDNYNDVPSSFQRARDLALRIEETEASFVRLSRKSDKVQAQLVDERKRLAARSSATLTAPVAGRLWNIHVASGEYVRKGQDLFSVLDCTTVVVTASVSERDYNELRLGEPVRFRVSGTDREYAGQIVKLGAAAGFAIPAVVGDHQVVARFPELAASTEDGCAVGRTGEITFDSRRHGLATWLVDAIRRFIGVS